MSPHLIFGLVLLAVFCAFYLWQTPGLVRGGMKRDEVEHYLGEIEKNLAALPQEDVTSLIEDLRRWGLADDGKPVYMLNLMRYYERLLPSSVVGNSPLTPAAANAHYEKSVMPLLLKNGDYPIFAGNVRDKNLVGHDPQADDWSRILVIRYTSRRHFFRLVSNPAYGPFAPYKFASLHLDLVPTRLEIALPDMRLALGALLLLLYVLVG